MELLEEIGKCSNLEEVDALITKAVEKANKESKKVNQLGFLENGKVHPLFQGFIPLSTRIRYSNFSIETYSMETTDFFYDFAHALYQNHITNRGSLIHFLETYINYYFGLPGKEDRETIFNDIAWQTTTTDEEYFAALEKNKIGDLKGKGAAECTERSALAQQILSLFGIETYYCIGCIGRNAMQEGHCFNIVKRKKDYALLDYSVPASYYADGRWKAYYPFVGVLSKEEFKEFVTQGVTKQFEEYEYVDGKQQGENCFRAYVVGQYQFDKKERIEEKKR